MCRHFHPHQLRHSFNADSLLVVHPNNKERERERENAMHPTDKDNDAESRLIIQKLKSIKEKSHSSQPSSMKNT